VIHERQQKAWELADLVVAPSEFVLHGLIEMGVPSEKCRVVPYGVDLARFSSNGKKNFMDICAERQNRQLRVLFAGAVGLRKGAPYLIKAAEMLGPERITVRLAGQCEYDPKLATAFPPNVEALGYVPRVSMPSLYDWADVFVLPSLCEGSATVVYEALAKGVPVVGP